ncbi:hypothetical protein CFter6_0021 [Collimonas fungivorans]|uniref:Uncharacterized protein n=1 Tax=Collimonas fungivorans TaxID=158899 RepID=A0A127P4I6_9BURK|nr:hypothetical protein CFter6_0021 [Collimonas fungivorans]
MLTSYQQIGLLRDCLVKTVRGHPSPSVSRWRQLLLKAMKQTAADAKATAGRLSIRSIALF